MKGLAPALFGAATFPLHGFWTYEAWENVARPSCFPNQELIAWSQSAHSLASYVFALLAWRYAAKAASGLAFEFTSTAILATGLTLAVQGAYCLLMLAPAIIDGQLSQVPEWVGMLITLAPFGAGPVACVLILLNAFAKVTGPLVVHRDIVVSE